MNASRTRLVIGVAAVSALGLSACVANNPSSSSASGSAGTSDAPLTVTITDDTFRCRELQADEQRNRSQ